MCHPTDVSEFRIHFQDIPVILLSCVGEERKKHNMLADSPYDFNLFVAGTGQSDWLSNLTCGPGKQEHVLWTIGPTPLHLQTPSKPVRYDWTRLAGTHPSLTFETKVRLEV